MTRGFFYLVAVMDWATRHVLSWRLSNTMDASFCVGALDDALLRATPEILNTDQGSQFTGAAFADRVLGAGAAFSMDGRGRFLDNIFIERLWRSLKYEAVYLHELRDGPDAERIIGRGSTSTTRCVPTRRWTGERRARPTAAARGRREQPARSYPDARCQAPAGSRPPGVPLPGNGTYDSKKRRSPRARQHSRNPPWFSPRTVQRNGTTSHGRESVTSVLSCALTAEGAHDPAPSLRFGRRSRGSWVSRPSKTETSATPPPLDPTPTSLSSPAIHGPRT